MNSKLPLGYIGSLLGGGRGKKSLTGLEILYKFYVQKKKNTLGLHSTGGGGIINLEKLTFTIGVLEPHVVESLIKYNNEPRTPGIPTCSSTSCGKLWKRTIATKSTTLLKPRMAL